MPNSPREVPLYGLTDLNASTGKRSLLSVLNVVVVFSAQLDLECGFQRTAQEKFALGRDFALIEGHPISHPWLLPRCIEHHRAEAVRNAHQPEVPLGNHGTACDHVINQCVPGIRIGRGYN